MTLPPTRTGEGIWQNLSVAESRTHFALWSVCSRGRYCCIVLHGHSTRSFYTSCYTVILHIILHWH
jgi:hypothetical protein